MVKKCVSCGYYYTPNGRSFHSFPRDLRRKLDWCEALGKNPIKLRKFDQLCSNHFAPNDFVIKPSGTKFLRSTAVPFIKHNDEDLQWVPDSEESNQISYDMPANSFSESSAKPMKAYYIKRSNQSGNVVYTLNNKGSPPLAGFPNLLISDVHTVTEADNSFTTTKEKDNLSSSHSPKERLEFLTIVEDIDDTSESSTDEQEPFQISSRSEPPPLNLDTTSTHNINSEIQPIPQLVLIPTIANSNTVAHNTLTSKYRPILPKIMVNSNLLVPNLPLTSTKSVNNNSVHCENEKQSRVVLSDSTKLRSSCESSPRKILSNGNSRVEHNSDNEYSPKDSEDHSSSSTLTASEGDETRRGTLRKKEKRKPLLRFFGDCSSDDMETPSRAKACWAIAKKTICNLKCKVKRLQTRNRHLIQRVECMRSLFRYLEENNFLNNHADAVVKAVMPDETELSLHPL